MSYKFNYKTNAMTLCEFTEELARVCGEWFINEHQPVVLKNAPKLYEDRALVYVVYRCSCCRDTVAYYERKVKEYTSRDVPCPGMKKSLEETRSELNSMEALIADMLS